MRGIEQIPWLYDASCAVMERLGLGSRRRWLVEDARGLALEVGCGTGRNLPLFPRHLKVVGLEPAWAPIRRARRRAPAGWLVCGRAEALPFRDGLFDTVVAGLVFCSVGDPARGLAEIRRVLKPDGALRMLEHVRSTRAWKAWLQDRAQPCWTWLTGGCHLNRDTERAVETAGFRIDPGDRRAEGDLRRFVARPTVG